MENIVANNIENKETFVDQPAKIDKRAAAPVPNKIPIIPPLKVITTDVFYHNIYINIDTKLSK